MPLSCFATASGDSSPAKASSATSVYWTHVGVITLTWSRSALGLVLTADVSLAGAPAPARFVLLPWLPWRRRASKRFSTSSGHVVVFSWDLSRASLAPRRPEPLSGYSVHVTVDGELALAAGDLAPASSPAASAGIFLSRRESAVVAGGGPYTTSVAIAGEEHEVSIGVEEAAMWVAVDGERALQVRRLRWKFRGSERLDLPRCGGSVRVTWDLHGWLFAPDAAAVFVLRFDADGANPMVANMDEDVGMHALKEISFRSHHGTGSVGGDSQRRRRGSWRRSPFRSGSDSSPTVSVASTSAASSSAASVATVVEWATAEEAALQGGGDGFSLIIDLWKRKKKSR